MMPLTRAVRTLAEARETMARALDGLALAGAEHSFKMGTGELLAGRYLAGIKRGALNAEEFARRCGLLSMPADYLDMLGAQFGEADSVHFGYEAGEGGCLYKVYLEFWQRLNRVTQAGTEVPLYVACKWEAQGQPGSAGEALPHNRRATDALRHERRAADAPAQRRAVSHYDCVAGIGPEQMAQRMRALCGAAGEGGNGAPAGPGLEAALALLAQASRHTRAPLMYLEVHEEGNPRASFDLRLYPAQLRLSDTHPLLLRAARAYGVEQEFNLIYTARRDRVLGHVSGGIGRDGRDFLTLYTPAEGA